MMRSEIESLWGVFNQSFCSVDFPAYLLKEKRLQQSLIDIIINKWRITSPIACIRIITDGNELERLMDQEQFSSFNRICIRNIFKGSSESKFEDWLRPFQETNKIFLSGVCSNTKYFIEPVKTQQKKYLCF